MRRHAVSLLALIALAIASPAHAQSKKIKIGVLPGVYADTVEALIPEAKAKGIEIETVEFTDWTTPNVALQNGDIDLNYFQHQPFLDNAIAARGYELGSAGLGILSNVGLYSVKHKTFAEIPEGGTVGLPNDPVNQGRSLLLLQRAGLIKLRDGVGFKGTLDDIVENPKKLKFREVEGPQLARITADVDLAFGYPHYIVAAKAFDPGSGLLYTGIDDKLYSIIFTARKDRVNDPVLKEIVTLYQNSQAVRAAIHKAYASNNKLYTLPWQ